MRKIETEEEKNVGKFFQDMGGEEGESIEKLE